MSQTTPKPLDAFGIPMRQHVARGGLCYEPFSGSGSQIMAGEANGRRVFAMEISPAYIDVAMKYRDRGDAYITLHTPLTDDIDAVYAALMELQAGGGGDVGAWLVHDRLSCLRGLAAGISEAAPASRANVRRENMVDTIMTFCVVWMAAT